MAHGDLNVMQTYLFNGFYPRLYKMNIPPKDFYPGYVQTYIERDARAIKNISNLGQFQVFLKKMCAGRTGQLLNLTSLGNECGISHTDGKIMEFSSPGQLHCFPAEPTF